MAEIERTTRERNIPRLAVPSSLTAETFYVRPGFRAVRDSCYGDERTIIMERSEIGGSFVGLVRITTGCSRLAQSWSDLLLRSDVFDGLSVILVRAMSGRPHSGNALPLHLRDRHQHTFVYLFYPFSCPVLTLVQLSDGERFLYSRRLQRDAQAAHNLSLRKRD